MPSPTTFFEAAADASDAPWPRRDLRPVIAYMFVVIGTVARLPLVGDPPSGEHLFRQTQTLFAIRGYAEHGIDLRVTYLPIFGDQQNVPFEFPVFQAIAGLLCHAGLSVDAAGRILALASFQICALLLWRLLRFWQGELAGLLGVVLFECLPFGLHWGAAPLIDFFSVAGGLAMVVAFTAWVDRASRPGLLFGSAFAGLVLLVKVTTFPAVGLLLLLNIHLVAREHGWACLRGRVALAMVAGPVVGVGALACWTAYADAVKERSSLTASMTSSALTTWNFGSTHQRLSSSVYATIAQHLGDQIVGPGLLGLVLSLVLVMLWGQSKDKIVTLWLLAALAVPPLIFLNLYFVHTYYLIAVYPVAVALMAMGLGAVLRLLPRLTHQLVAGGAVAVIVIGLVAADPLGYRLPPSTRKVTDAPPGLLSGVQSESKMTDNIVVVGCDWSPAVLYMTRRTGLMLAKPAPATFWRSSRMTFEFLATCDPSIDLRRFTPPGCHLAPTGVRSVFAIRASGSMLCPPRL